MCFRVAIIRITEHFVFQGAEGAEAAAELRVAVSVLGITLKSFKFLVKNSVLGSGGCRFALRVSCQIMCLRFLLECCVSDFSRNYVSEVFS